LQAGGARLLLVTEGQIGHLTSGNSEDPAIGAETVRCGEKYLYVFKGAPSARRA
jgi:hypothetical protein